MRLITLFLILSKIFFSGNLYSQVEAYQEIEFGENPGDLKAFVCSPSSHQESKIKRPLVVALHGCSQNGNNLSSISGWSKMAEDNDFVVLYPQQKRKNNMSNCFNWFDLEDLTGDSGELQSIMNMIDYSIKSYNIDTSQIYVYGVSAGAAMGVCLLANYPGYFKVGAILAGAPYKIAVNNREAAKAMFNSVDKSPEEWGSLVTQDSIKQSYPKLIVCHGTKDKVVDIHNSYELIEQWTYLHEIDIVPDEISLKYMSNEMDKLVYKDTAGQEKIVFYKFINVGHTIPIDPGNGKEQGGELGMFSKDVDYFSTYFIAEEFGLID